MKPASRLADTWLPRALLAAVVGVGLWGVVLVHAAGQALLAVTMLVITAAAAWVYGWPRTSASRYLFPGIAAAVVFVIFPMVYTVSIGFTNQSSTNLLDQAQARAYLLEERVAQPETARPFEVEPAGPNLWRVRLQTAEGGGPEWVSASLPLRMSDPSRMEAALAATGEARQGEALSLRERVELLPALRLLTLRAPDGQPYELISLREFAVALPLYRADQASAAHQAHPAGPAGGLVDTLTGTVYQPDDRTGFYTSTDGQRLQPGYRVDVGLQHYERIFTDPRFREPFVSVFTWTVLFSGLTVLGAGALGLLLAVLLNWDGLRGKAAYRMVLFLPYAVPGFISILVFKGLFNQNLGEINLILHGLFGIRPAWFSDPLLAKVMLLVVNIWLGFPYMMVLCSGLIKAIPADLYEASAVVGAGPWTNFSRITLPLILKPLTPLLISAFAFNFNNFVLISLLTGGRPDQLDTALPAGTTDILVSYTWRIAFQDSGQQFGLAAAISTVIFLIVAAITLVQMRLTRVAADEARR
jgi:maltose/maltodextrin transport system permease protein